MISEEKNTEKIVACSRCFEDQGLYLEAEKIGYEKYEDCPNCSRNYGKKLTISHLEKLAYCYFVKGSTINCDYGAFEEIQFNPYQKTSVDLNVNLEKDIKIFESILGIGFFYYGPKAWMYGEIEPLKELLDSKKRNKVIKRIITDSPQYIITSSDSPFYRIRKGENLKYKAADFDSPPNQYLGLGRFDLEGHPVFYCSPDLELCMHEARVTIEDELYVATLIPKYELKLLNLYSPLQEDVTNTQFESLALALEMLFNTGKRAYEVLREIGIAAKVADFDGIVYPSYFRHIRDTNETITSKNLAIFGRPIQEDKVLIKSIDRLILSGVKYDYFFGPVKSDT